jgi:hypothetical protein
MIHPDKPSDYKVTFTAYDITGKVFKEGQIIAKKKFSDFEAMAGTEKYLKNKHKEIVNIKFHKAEIQDVLLGLANDFDNFFSRMSK